MKSVSILSLTLRNFKGVREFILDASGANVEVYGDNAVGKTTIFDAFTWLLFDKDSANRKDFDIKTLDKAGNVLQGLDHEVEVMLMVDGRQMTLRKVFAEKWTKKRGSVTQEFTGHSTDYFIDGVPVKQKEYKDRVDGIVQEHIFKLLTSPTFFNEQVKWQDRRNILLEVCGDISDTEVVASNILLTKLSDILSGRSIEDHRKIIAAKRADINKEIEKIPVRIDEAMRSMPDTNGLDEEAIQHEMQSLKKQIEAKDGEAFRLRQGGQRMVKENQLREIEGDLLEIKNRVQAGTLDAVNVKRMEVSQLRTDLENIRFKRTKLASKIAYNNEVIETKNSEADRLRKEWNEVNSEIFDHEHRNENCPSCGQELPVAQLEAAYEKAYSAFNLKKSERLEQITFKGKAAAGEAKHLKEENSELLRQIEDLEQQQAAKEEELSAAENSLNELQAGITDVETDPAYIAKKQETEAVKQEIDQLRLSSQEAIQKVQDELTALKAEAAELEANKAKFGQVRTIEQRIEDLKQQEKTLASEYERLEQELYLTEEFIRTKVTLLEEKINSKFRFARFKLFEQQINGGLAEVCETTFNGVPYSSGLNNAARINVGLDIINTLSEHYGFSAPIFIDNAESVTELINAGSQMIKLTVPPKFERLPFEARQRLIALHGSYEEARTAWAEQGKQLRVEVQEKTMREAV